VNSPKKCSLQWDAENRPRFTVPLKKVDNSLRELSFLNWRFKVSRKKRDRLLFFLRIVARWHTVNREVAIAGVGVAGCATAFALLQHGLHPVLLNRQATALTTLGGIEAIPPRATPFVERLGWDKVLLDAGAAYVEGFENGLNEGSPIVHGGCYWHVDRARLASIALRAALDAGAELIEVDEQLPEPQLDAADRVRVGSREFGAAVDATGRSTAWIGDRIRFGRESADVYTAPMVDQHSTEHRRGAIARVPGGWAYCIGLDSEKTIGVVHSAPHPTPAQPISGEAILGTDLAKRWSVAGVVLTRIARRPAFVQRAVHPVIADRLFAVGDAAFASNPISGQGILFSLASALAVSAAINSTQQKRDPKAAVEYYQEFVSANVRSHIRFSNDVLSSDLPAASSADSVTLHMDREVICRLPTVQHTIRTADGLSTGPVLELSSGELVRWYGVIDLVVLAASSRTPVLLQDLERYLCRCGWHPHTVRKALAWCLRNGVLREPV
jgi:flavin-dependent dehydrogenase